MASPVKDSAWLAWIASLMRAGSRQTQTAYLPPGQFHCLLDELPLHLVPRSQFLAQRRLNHNEALFLNPLCSILPPGHLPAELKPHAHLLEGFNLESTVAWVREKETCALRPFWLGPGLRDVIKALRPSEPIPESVPQQARNLLADAGILTSIERGEQRQAEWAETVKQGALQFREKGYAPLAGLIHPFHVAALRRYYRHAIRSGKIQLGDVQSPRRYIAHNESIARFFHHQIANAVSAIVGEAIKPSYVYLASYLSAAELKKHTDREQCEFSLTWCLDFSPEPELATSWPIRLDNAEGNVAVYQALGDGLVYRGTKIPHYRDRLAKGYTSTSIFFHYVPAAFSGPLN
jgi:hypothetical protein